MKSKPWGYTKPPLGATLNANDPINLGIKHLWLFNEYAGGKIYDPIGQNPGTLTGGATWGNGKFGAALNLDGSTGYITGVNSQSITSTQTSVAFWMRFTANLSNTFPRLIDFQDASNSIQVIWDAAAGAGGSTYWVTKHSQFQSSVNGTQWGVTPTVGVDYCIVACFDSVANTTTFYVNGKSLTGSANSNIGRSQINNVYYLGARRDLNAETFGAIKFHTCRIWNRILNSTEAMRLYLEPFAGVNPPRIGIRQGAVATYSITPAPRKRLITDDRRFIKTLPYSPTMPNYPAPLN